MSKEWGKWFRENSDKYLVGLAIGSLLLYNLHIMHHAGDTAQIQFVNGIVNNLTGAFLTLVTGAIVRKTATATAITDTEGGKTEVTKVEDK